jgi:hypothetical protein
VEEREEKNPKRGRERLKEEERGRQYKLDEVRRGKKKIKKYAEVRGSERNTEEVIVSK